MPPPLDAQLILEAVADVTGVEMVDLLGPKRNLSNIVEAKRLAAYVLYKWTGRSWPWLASMVFGEISHSGGHERAVGFVNSDPVRQVQLIEAVLFEVLVRLRGLPASNRPHPGLREGGPVVPLNGYHRLVKRCVDKVAPHPILPLNGYGRELAEEARHGRARRKTG